MDVIDRKFFFDTCKKNFGSFKQSQVDGIDFLVR